MVKETKNIDFYTTGRQLSDQEFEQISEWIRKKKQGKSIAVQHAVKRKRQSKLNPAKTEQ